ncbi:hypothetical protein J3R82DRAFT_2815 [Butyriboletus roseoflavus]|nr:hypothetical protein J3R82DRAFT_2815 [Butyriboletus roseoflavus]
MSNNNHIIVDTEAFKQILKFDKEDDQEFFKDTVGEYLKEAHATIELMDQCLCTSLSYSSTE